MTVIAKSSAMAGVTGTAHPRALYDDRTRAEAVRLHRAGKKKSAIARQLGCHRWSVSRWVQESEAAEREMLA